MRPRGAGRLTAVSRSVLVLLFMVTSLAAACAKTTGEPADSSARSGPRQAVDAMLRQRSKSLTTRDVEGYLAPMTPEARTVEEPIARGSATVPLAEVSMLMDEADFDDAGKVVSGARVDFIYRYKELPEDNLFRFRLVYDLELRDGAWVVTRSRHDDSKGPLPVWARGPVSVARSEHFVALHRPDTTRVEESLALAEGARMKLLQGLTIQTEDKHLLLLAKDQVEYHDMGNPELGSSLAAVFYIFRSSAAHPTRAENRHMIVNLDAVLKDPDRKADVGPEHGAERGATDEEDEPDIPPELRDAVEKLQAELVPAQVFQHELGHLVLSRVTRESTPGWVSEGGAMLLADERRLGSWDLGQRLDVYKELYFSELSRDANLGNGIEYAYANAAVSYLVETFGEKKFWDFYRDFKEYEPTGAMEAHPLEDVRGDATHRLLRRIYDMNEEQLDEKTREYIKKAAA